MKRLFAFGAAMGAALAYFFDPETGNRRRSMTRDRVLAFFRRTGRQAGRAGQAAKSQAYGVTQEAVHLKDRTNEQPDDAALAHKVETELFRDADVPKGDINVNAENGVVFLRGEVADESLAEALGKSARKIQGVREVENLLHTPGTPAPTKQG
ncbi:MAG TPA: BON domain-containing protein [Gaiellaceae bacterium]|nr:BON domain-containing protein [Gaiellaceae bacterium]